MGGLLGGDEEPARPQSSPQQNINTVRHDKFGQVVPSFKYNRSYITVTKPIPPRVKFSDWELQYQAVASINKEHLLMPESYTVTKANNVCCPHPDAISLVFQDYPTVLSLEIEQRRHKQRFYSEQEIWYFMFSGAQALREFQRLGKRVGDVRPANILLNEKGKIKLINKFSWPGEDSGFEKICEGRGEKCYIAPEEVNALKKNAFTSVDMNSPLLDAFSFGLTILDMVLLISSDSLYGMGCRSFEQMQFNRRMNLVSNRYSPFLKTQIQNLTQLLPNMRVTGAQIFAILSPYAQSINSMQKFHPTHQKSSGPLKQQQLALTQSSSTGVR